MDFEKYINWKIYQLMILFLSLYAAFNLIWNFHLIVLNVLLDINYFCSFWYTLYIFTALLLRSISQTLVMMLKLTLDYSNWTIFHNYYSEGTQPIWWYSMFLYGWSCFVLSMFVGFCLTIWYANNYSLITLVVFQQLDGLCDVLNYCLLF